MDRVHVGDDEQQELNLTTFPGYHYVRHKDERWIRCAMTASKACLECPLEIRTEIYNIPCPTCSQDDPCILSAQPIRTYKHPSPNMTSEKFAYLAMYYAYEVITLLTSFYRIQINNGELKRSDWNTYERGLYCTQDSSHIKQDVIENPNGPLTVACHLDCACTVLPWAHNASRAARNQNATQVRIRAAPEWFTYSYTDIEPSLWISWYFGDTPNQFWLNMHEEGPQRYTDAMALITKAAYDLDRLGPTIQVPGNGGSDVYAKSIRTGQFTASQLITLPCLDPGITTEFLDFLMREHFLTALCPYIHYMTNDQIRILDCQVEPSLQMKTLLYYSRRAFVNNDTRREVYRDGVKQSALVNGLGRNRDISHQNALIKKQVSERFAFMCVANSQYAASKTQTCPICADDFDDTNPTLEIPMHIRAVEMPCCHQFMHFRCLKGTAIRWGKCSLCNRNLKEVGLSIKTFAPGQDIRSEVRQQDLPEGMMRRPNAAERNLVDFNRHIIIDAIGDHIARRGPLPPFPDAQYDLLQRY